MLEDEQMIVQRTTHLTSIISICNYSKYQDGENSTVQPTEQPTVQQAVQQAIQHTVQQAVHRQECKEYKNEKNITKPAKSRANRKKKLPENFTLTDELKNKAIGYWEKNNRQDLDPDDQFDRFTNHHKAKGSTMADWGAAWQTWYSNSVTFSKPKGDRNENNQNPNQQSTTDTRSAAGRVRAAAEAERRKIAEQRANNPSLGADDQPVWPPMDEQLRGSDRSRECLGGITEGDYIESDSGRLRRTGTTGL
jgi:hypothetical protein